MEPALEIENPESEKHAEVLWKRYNNARVIVYYLSGVSDTGYVTYLSAPWIEITKDNDERLLIPMTAVRLIKMLEPPKAADESMTLLRASDNRK